MSLDNNIRFALFLAAIFATALPIPEPAPVIRIFLLESESLEMLKKEHVS